MTAPRWLNSVLREFGAGIDLQNFELNNRNAAVMHFETGTSLRFEYAFESLVIAMEIPAPPESDVIRQLLIYTQPERVMPFQLRVAFLSKTSSALMTARLSEHEVSLPAINAVFTELWHLAEDFRRRIQ